MNIPFKQILDIPTLFYELLLKYMLVFKMKYEKPQLGNPYQLPIFQHIFPLRSIERYINEQGYVETKILKQNVVKYLKPANPLFCGKRIWDNRAETGYMRKIEDDFQKIVFDILEDDNYRIDNESRAIVTQFYALWRTRFVRKLDPITDTKLKGIDWGIHCPKNRKNV